MGARVIDDGQGGLVFTSVTPDDAGTYTCTGSTFEGTDTDKAVLIVGGKCRNSLQNVSQVFCAIDQYRQQSKDAKHFLKS